MNIHVPDDPRIDTYGQDAGYCEVCEEHLDSGRCPGHCENGTCDHESHCEVCERDLNYRPDSGICFLCEAQWLASHRLTDSHTLSQDLPMPVLAEKRESCPIPLGPQQARESNIQQRSSGSNPPDSRGGQNFAEPIGMIAVLAEIARRFTL